MTPTRLTRPPLPCRLGTVIVLGLLTAALGRPAAAEGPAPADSPLVRMLKGGRVPEDRQGAIVATIGKRGTPADLEYLLGRAVGDGGSSAALRLQALEALAEAAETRDRLRPAGDLGRLAPLIDGSGPGVGPPLRSAAARLAGFYQEPKLGPALRSAAGSDGSDAPLRASALDALAALGGPEDRSAIESLTRPGRPAAVRLPAVAALARLDVEGAARAAVGLMAEPGSADLNLNPLVSAFLNRRGGAEVLAAAVAAGAPPPDAAKLALRSVYALGRSDPALVDALTRASGIDAKSARPLDPPAMAALIAEVAAKGDPARGETVFRRADVNCAGCHALSGAGGGVGPELSAVGAGSPVDYLANSILLPDQSIKETFQTLVVQTADGQVYQGVVADRDDRRIVLREATGALRTVPTADVEASKEGGSLMPKGLTNFMTRGEFVDLLRFLSELGKPGPYAVRSTPTVQRWRSLSPVPEGFAGLGPDADPSRWRPAYARVGGSLPLNELTASAGGRVVVLRADLDVSHGDPVAITLDSPAGVTAWVDDRPAPPFTGRSFTLPLITGHHTLTFRVDLAARPGADLRVEVLKPPGSSAEYAVNGGL